MTRKKLTDDFFEDEFYSPDTMTGTMNKDFMLKLQRLRTAVGVRFKITSGFRTAAQNEKVKGAKDSQHLTGNAADLSHADWNGYTKRKFLSAALSLNLSVGIYKKHFHVDDRTGLHTVWIGDNVLD